MLQILGVKGAAVVVHCRIFYNEEEAVSSTFPAGLVEALAKAGLSCRSFSEGRRVNNTAPFRFCWIAQAVISGIGV
jgi:hypothetical protein